MRKLVWFVMAGGTGFAIDAGLTQLLIALTPPVRSLPASRRSWRP